MNRAGTWMSLRKRGPSSSDQSGLASWHAFHTSCTLASMHTYINIHTYINTCARIHIHMHQVIVIVQSNYAPDASMLSPPTVWGWLHCLCAPNAFSLRLLTRAQSAHRMYIRWSHPGCAILVTCQVHTRTNTLFVLHITCLELCTHHF